MTDKMEYIKNKNICKPKGNSFSTDREKIFEIQILNIRNIQVTPIYQKNMSTQKKNGNNKYRQFTERKVQIANKYIKKMFHPSSEQKNAKLNQDTIFIYQTGKKSKIMLSNSMSLTL